MIGRRLVITGQVQGVGFRDGLCRVAQRAGVTGWVRNRRDGSVEAFVQGRGEAVDGVIAWAQRGPPAARVDAVDLTDGTPDANLGGFEFRATA